MIGDGCAAYLSLCLGKKDTEGIKRGVGNGITMLVVGSIILDPIAIFVLRWGVKGAAIATIAGQIVSAVLAVYYLFHTKFFRLSRRSFRPNGSILRHVLPLGISSFLTQLSIVIIMGVMNNVLVKYGAMSKYGADIPMTVVGIVMKVFQIVIAFVIGVAAGSQPIVGYNFGAEGLLFSAPIADVVTFLVMIVMVRSVMKELRVSTKKEEVESDE